MKKSFRCWQPVGRGNHSATEVTQKSHRPVTAISFFRPLQKNIVASENSPCFFLQILLVSRRKADGTEGIPQGSFTASPAVCSAKTISHTSLGSEMTGTRRNRYKSIAHLSGCAFFIQLSGKTGKGGPPVCVTANRQACIPKVLQKEEP